MDERLPAKNAVDSSDDTPEIAIEVAALRKEIAELNSQRFLRVHNNYWRLFLMRFTSGLFTGLGTVIGATVLVSLVVVWLQQIEWVPLIGDWASQISERIEQNVEQSVREGVRDAIAPETGE
jgi:hypothetical protein